MKNSFERITETAKRLGYSRETIRIWVASGYFPGAIRAPKKGSEWRIPRGAVPDFTPAERQPDRRGRR